MSIHNIRTFFIIYLENFPKIFINIYFLERLEESRFKSKIELAKLNKPFGIGVIEALTVLLRSSQAHDPRTSELRLRLNVNNDELLTF